MVNSSRFKLERLILFLFVADLSIAQNFENKTLSSKMWEMGRPISIMEAEIPLTIYQLTEAPADLIDFIPRVRLIQFSNWLYRGYPYWDVVDPSTGMVYTYATHYFQPEVNWLNKVNNMFAMGITGKTKLAFGGSEVRTRYNYALLTNFKFKNLLIGNATKIKMKRTEVLYEMDADFEWQEQVAFLLCFKEFKFGSDIANRLNYYPENINSDQEISFYTLTHTCRFKSISKLTYYFDRTLRYYQRDKRIQSYIFSNWSGFNFSLIDKKMVSGLGVNYRGVKKTTEYSGEIPPSILNIIPNFTINFEKITLTGEAVILKQDHKNWTARPKLGIDIFLGTMGIQFIASLAEEAISGSEVEFEQFLFNWQPVFHYQELKSVYYSAQLSYRLASNFFLQYCAGVQQIERQPTNLFFNISINSK